MRCDLTCATCRTAWGFRTQERNALQLEDRDARNRRPLRLCRLRPLEGCGT